jgi:hypothetical protein
MGEKRWGAGEKPSRFFRKARERRERLEKVVRPFCERKALKGEAQEC